MKSKINIAAGMMNFIIPAFIGFVLKNIFRFSLCPNKLIFYSAPSAPPAVRVVSQL